MPIHDWTRISPGGFHTFHQNWTIEIYRALNRGILPEGYSALTDLRVDDWVPDVVGVRSSAAPAAGGVAVQTAPPKIRQTAKVATDSAVYARRANCIVVRHEFGEVVAVIEVVSPGNKDTVHAIAAFRRKAVDFLRRGVGLLVVDLFPPPAATRRGFTR